MKIDQVLISDSDSKGPLRFTHMSSLVIGAMSLLERLQYIVKEIEGYEVSFHANGTSLYKRLIRAMLGGRLAEEVGGKTVLFLSSNLILDKEGANALQRVVREGVEGVYLDRLGRPILGITTADAVIEGFRGVRVLGTLNLSVVKGPWDLVRYSSKMLRGDLITLSSLGRFRKVDLPNVLGKHGVYMAGDVEVEPCVVFDTRNGPVVLDEGSYVQGPSRIEGPTYIGRESLVAAGANLRRVYIGPKCNVGGEVVRSTFLRYSNSRHQSYIGDSYLGEFVNIGALSVTSNLKNTYGYIRYKGVEGPVETGMRKLGVIFGDHSKVSVGSTLYGGISVGVSSHVHYRAARSVPDFVIWVGGEAYELRVDSAVRTARRMAQSKGVVLPEEYYRYMEELYRLTESGRRGVRRGVLRL